MKARLSALTPPGTMTEPTSVYRTEPAMVEKHWLNVPGVQVLPYECTR